MIEKIRIKNFKSHRDTCLDLGHLTVLCGQNGVGKSSVLQALLLLRQSHLKNRLHQVLDLNKPLCDIGTAYDALYQGSESNAIQFSLWSNHEEHTWEFKFDPLREAASFLDVVSKPSADKGLAIFTNSFQYLSASRLAPQESYPKDDFEVERNSQISIEKGKGELVAHFLHHYGSRLKVSDSRLQHPDAVQNDLLSQANAWEREISRGVNVRVAPTGTGFELKYNFAFPGYKPTADFRAENVGFGLSYALPIIVAILAAKEGSVLLIENPEAHLHPQGQARLTDMMCRAAETGIQIIVETHSDHIVNGVLVGCKKHEQDPSVGLDRSRVSIYYFDRDETEHATIATRVGVAEGGKIENQPPGFFDQIEIDLRQIMGF